LEGEREARKSSEAVKRHTKWTFATNGPITVIFLNKKASIVLAKIKEFCPRLRLRVFWTIDQISLLLSIFRFIPVKISKTPKGNGSKTLKTYTYLHILGHSIKICMAIDI
jgi:hypothetical protein